MNDSTSEWLVLICPVTSILLTDPEDFDDETAGGSHAGLPRKDDAQ